MKANSKINDFISDTLFVDEKKGEIVISLRELILKTFPKTEEEIKYGGLVFIIDKRLFCGIFLRKNHISVEFDYGAEMSDPDRCCGFGGVTMQTEKFHFAEAAGKPKAAMIKETINDKTKKRS